MISVPVPVLQSATEVAMRLLKEVLNNIMEFL